MRDEPVPKDRYRVYLARAAESHALMEQAVEREWWHGAAITAVHTVISAADAMTTFYLGVRSRSPSHGDVVGLLKRIEVKDAAAKADVASQVLAKKNHAEYESSAVPPRQAEMMAKQASRFFAWARENLPR